MGECVEEFQMCPTVHILIINWNGAADTLDCLESLRRLRYSRTSIVVIDNGSIDDSPAQIGAWMRREYGGEFSEIFLQEDLGSIESFSPGDVGATNSRVLIRSSVNRGFAGGVNLGIRFIFERGGDGFFWLLNNDTIVEPDTLNELVLAVKNDPSVGIVGSSLFWHHDPTRLQMAGGKWVVPLLGVLGVRTILAGVFPRRFFVSGASLLIGVRTVREIGLLDERFFFYGEDADWSLRACRHGLTVKHCPLSRVWHKGGHSIGSETPLQEYYLTKATLLFYSKNYPWYLPLAIVLGTGLRLFLKAVRGQLRIEHLRMMGRAYLDFFRRPSGAVR